MKNVEQEARGGFVRILLLYLKKMEIQLKSIDRRNFINKYMSLYKDII